MVLRKAESEIKTMLADTILAMCSSTLSCNSEICVEGLIGVTIDRQEVILVQVNKMMRKGKGKQRVISNSTPRDHSSKKTKAQFYESDDDLPTIHYGKRQRKMSWKMRESLTPAKDNDHDYISQPEKNRKKKRKSASPMGITPITSSDDDGDVGFDAHSDMDTSQTDLSQSLSQSLPNTPGRKSMNSTRTNLASNDSMDPRPSTSHHDDPDLIDGLSVANLEQQLNSTAEDLLQGAQEVVGEVVETEDGQLVIKLGEMQPPLVNQHGIPYDIGQTSDQTHYRVIKGGTTMGRDMLTDNVGYSYAISRNSKPTERKGNRGARCTYWRCSVRASAQQRLNGGVCCGASVVERDGVYRRGDTPHIHPPKEDLHPRLLIGKMVREKAKMLENLSIPSSHIFQEAVASVMAEDPSLSYESLTKYKTLFERRFNRARKDCISAKTKIPNIGIRHLVRATQQHMRDERKSLKLQSTQQPDQQQQLEHEHLQVQQVQEQPLQHQQQQQVEMQPQRVQIIVTQNT